MLLSFALVIATTAQTNAASTRAGSEQQGFGQSGVTVAISNPLITALQTGMQMAQAAEDTQGDARLQALADLPWTVFIAQHADAIQSPLAAPSPFML